MSRNLIMVVILVLLVLVSLFQTFQLNRIRNNLITGKVSAASVPQETTTGGSASSGEALPTQRGGC